MLMLMMASSNPDLVSDIEQVHYFYARSVSEELLRFSSRSVSARVIGEVSGGVSVRVSV